MERREEVKFEKIPSVRPGVEVLRLRRRPKRRLRVAPHMPDFFRFLKDAFTRTPLIPMLMVLLISMFVFSGLLYAFESGTGNEHIKSFGDALFWVIAVMETMGMSSVLTTTKAKVLMGLWAFVGCGLFWGVLIATITAYFQLPRRRPSQEIISTVQYNLERIEDLSLEELEALRTVTLDIIDSRISMLRKNSGAS